MKRGFLLGALCLVAGAAQAQYAGLVISEVISNPAEDEMIEVTNTSAAAIDISGVILTDEETAQGEGALAFPVSTTLAAGATVVVAVAGSATEPTWLDAVPAGVRVFTEPARVTTSWTAAHGNTITPMVDLAVPTATISLSATDNVVLMKPTATFTTTGIVDATQTIDGVSWDVDGPYSPINPSGQLDTAVTVLSGNNRSASGNVQFSYQRTHNNASTGSYSTYLQDVPNVGTYPESNGAKIRNAAWYQRTIGEGAVAKTLRFDSLFNSRQVIHVVEYDDTLPNTDMEFVYGTSPTRKTVPAFAAGVPTATAVINGNFFDISGTGETVNFLRVGGTIIGATDSSGHSGAAIVDAAGNTTTMAYPASGGWTGVAQPNVMSTRNELIVAKIPDSFSTTDAFMTGRNPRTAVGRTPEGKVLMVVVDGRQTIAAGMTMDEMAIMMMALGASEAVNMDGGGSSTMWDTDLPGNGVANLPSDGSLRAVANALVAKIPASTAPVPAFDARRGAVALDASPHDTVDVTMQSEGTASVTLSFVNSGSTTWTQSAVFLGTAETFDHAGLLYNSADWISSTRPTALDQASVAPGATGTFTFVLKAPAVVAAQVVEESYSLVTNTGTHFGPWQNRVYAVVSAPATAGEIVVESRDVGGTVTASPAYAETGSFGSTTSKSTVTGPGLSGAGSRYNNGVGATGTFRPTIVTAGNYNVYVTLGSGTNNNANASWVLTNAGANVTGTVSLSYTNTNLVNKWLLLASNVPMNAGSTAGITFTNVDGNNSIGARFVMDAVRFSGPTTQVDDWMIY